MARRKQNLMAGLHPQRAHRAADISRANDANFHRRSSRCRLRKGSLGKDSQYNAQTQDNRQTAKKLSTQKISRNHDKLLSIELFRGDRFLRFANIGTSPKTLARI